MRRAEDTHHSYGGDQLVACMIPSDQGDQTYTTTRVPEFRIRIRELGKTVQTYTALEVCRVTSLGGPTDIYLYRLNLSTLVSPISFITKRSNTKNVLYAGPLNCIILQPYSSGCLIFRRDVCSCCLYIEDTLKSMLGLNNANGSTNPTVWT